MASNEQQTRISIERKEYAMLVTAAKKYKATVQSLQQFHIQVEEKNTKIKQVEDTKIKLEVALEQAEQRIANLISIQEKEKINKSDVSKTHEGTIKVEYVSIQERNDPTQCAPRGTLETDCAKSIWPSSLPPPYEETESHPLKPTEKSLFTRENAATPYTGHTHDSVPREIFEKVTSENVRLRNQLDGEEQDKDMFRDAAEYEDIIKQLKVDQVNLHGQVNRLQRILTTMKDGNHSALGTHLVELQSKVAKQDKVIETKATLLEMYGKEKEKLKNEIDSLKLQLFKVTGSTPQDSISGSKQELPKESYVSHLEKEIEKVKESASKDKNDLKTSLKKVVADKVLLQQKCEEYAASVDSLMKSRITKDMPTTLVELQRENIELSKKLNVYRHELEKTITEKDIADTQAQLFKEDFEEERAEKEKGEEEFKKVESRLLQDLASKKGHISRLSNECAQLSKKWTEDKNQKLLIEKKYQDTKKQYEGLIQTLKTMGAIKESKGAVKSCATTVGPAIKLSQPISLCVDSSITEQPTLSSLCVDSSLTEQPSRMSGATAKPDLTCPRCLRDFTDQQVYKEHVQKCMTCSSSS